MSITLFFRTNFYHQFSHIVSTYDSLLTAVNVLFDNTFFEVNDTSKSPIRSGLAIVRCAIVQWHHRSLFSTLRDVLSRFSKNMFDKFCCHSTFLAMGGCRIYGVIKPRSRIEFRLERIRARCTLRKYRLTFNMC